MNSRYAMPLVFLVASVAGCGDDATLPAGCDRFVAPGDDDDASVQEMFLALEDGQTGCLGAGTFRFTRELTISANDVTIRGTSQDDTVLDFSAQDVGGSGIKVSGDGVTIRDLAVQDTPGDGITASSVEGITYEALTVRWTRMYDMNNGAYGVYPVNSQGVVIRGVTVVGARDAGIYVGQSRNILVEDSVAHDNVAGIEIENSFDAVVRNNEAYDNTGGLLIFNLPTLQVKNGERTLAYGNEIHENNVDNWGVPGTAVAEVPRGTGILVLAADGNELRDNLVYDNDSFGIILSSYIILDPAKNFETADPEFDAYAEANFVHDNVLDGNGSNPDDLPSQLIPQIRPIPPLGWDGCENPNHDNGMGEFTNCFVRNTDSEGTPSAFLNVDVCGQPPFANQNQDLTPHMCERMPLEDPYE
ncbi:MAG: hypothetical protein D6705_17450 [Deltaproteobacteria bacterium]|nr:MAG: hypothetical protein D6705_17450 [Deltaproteobacteria bacterium]